MFSWTVPGSVPHSALAPSASQCAGPQYCAVSGVRAPCLANIPNRHSVYALSCLFYCLTAIAKQVRKQVLNACNSLDEPMLEGCVQQDVRTERQAGPG